MVPIYAGFNFRIRDYDDNRYVVERRHIKGKGEKCGSSVWAIIGYCGSPKSVLSVLKEAVVTEHVSAARIAAAGAFHNYGIEDIILALPKKGK